MVRLECLYLRDSKRKRIKELGLGFIFFSFIHLFLKEICFQFLNPENTNMSDIVQL